MGTAWGAPAAAAAVALCAVLVWLPSLGAGFVSDDFALLRAAEAVDSPAWPFGHNDLGQDAGSGHFYRPLWVLWSAGVLELFGDQPAAFHAGNLLLFALIAVEVLLLARPLLTPARAAGAALAFALYPRHGEAVAFASGSADLLAVAAGLGALLCVSAPWPRSRRLPAAALLTGAAALAKEVAFVLPVLALLLAPARGERWSAREALAGPAAMGGALVLVFAVRTAVLGGLGEYSNDTAGPGRVVAAAVSYTLGAVSPAQLQVLRTPYLLVVPMALAGLLAWALWRSRGERAGVALTGLAWFGLALVPLLGLPLDLNNAAGERLLLLPSVGLALAFGALLPARMSRTAAGVLAVGAVAAALLSLDVARSWDRAGTIADRVANQAAALAPFEGALVVVTLPDSYRTARVFDSSFDLAVGRAGAFYSSLTWCIPVSLREERAGAVTVAAGSSRTFLAEATWDAPLDFRLLRDPNALEPGCSYAATDSGETAPGLRLRAIATAGSDFGEARVAYFDGRDLRLMSAK